MASSITEGRCILMLGPGAFVAGFDGVKQPVFELDNGSSVDGQSRIPLFGPGANRVVVIGEGGTTGPFEVAVEPVAGPG